jgi:subtilisin family serine protease
VPGGAYRPAALPAPHSLAHAVFVAGMIVQRAPGADVQAHQVLADDGSSASAWDVARTMAAFARSGVSVLNMSFGCITRDGQPPLVLARAVDLLTPDVVLVAAAGNHGAEEGRAAASAVYPAAFDDVIAVGAHNGTGTAAAFSPTLPWVDLIAPGVRVTSTYPVRFTGGPGYDGQAVWSGTSFATAHVTGVIAAHTEPGRVDARQALQRLMDLKPGEEYCGVRRFYLAS